MRQPQNSQQPITDNQEAPEPAPREQENLQQPSIQQEQAPSQEPPAQTQPEPYAPTQQPPDESTQQFAQNSQQPPQPQQPEASQQQPQPQPEIQHQPVQNNPNPQEPMPPQQGQENAQQNFQETQEEPANPEPGPQPQPYTYAPQQPPDPGDQQQTDQDAQQQPDEPQQTEEELLQTLKNNQQQGSPQIQNFNRRGTTRPIVGDEQQPDQQQEKPDEHSVSASTNTQTGQENMSNPEDAFEQPVATPGENQQIQTEAESIPTDGEMNVSFQQPDDSSRIQSQSQGETQSQNSQAVGGQQQDDSTVDQAQEFHPADQQFTSQQEESTPNQTTQTVEPANHENQPMEPTPHTPPQQQTQDQQPEAPVRNQPGQPVQTDAQPADDPQQLVSGEGFAAFDESQHANEQPQAAPPQDEVATVPATGTDESADKTTPDAFNFPQQQINPDAESSSQVTRMDQPVAATDTQQQVKSFKTKAQDAASKVKKVNYKPLITAAIFGIVIFTIFNSQVILGQVQYFTTPSGSVETPVGATEVDAPVGDENRILIPQIDVNVPVVYDEPSFKEEKVQKALERGVVHYGNTAMPGEKGNSVIVGHSSNNWWNSGKYKFAFILLDKLNEGDEIVLHYEGTRYVYEVTNKKVVVPTNTSVLDQSGDPRITLITCTPPGTSWKRLIVEAKQVSPDPSENVETDSSAQEATKLPDDSGSGGFFESIGEWF